MQSPSKSKYYDDGFYAFKRASALASARTILSELKKVYDFNSVLDVGCGDCIWGVACSELDIIDYIGLDGEYAKTCVPERLIDQFIPHNLESSEAFPVQRCFDLVISLEVAEHLSKSCAENFINQLTKAGEVVMFSAAIPGQGGSNHVNEQWQSYWASLFRNEGFASFDLIRPAVWGQDQVAEYYRQNILLYCSRKRTDLTCAFRAAAEDIGPLLDVIHPYTYNRLLDLSQAPLLDYLRAFPKILKRATFNRIKR